MEELRQARSKKPRFVSRVLLTLVFATALVSPFAWSSEATLRAAFVYNFVKFIHWPSEQSNSNINLCALGATPEVRGALERLQGLKANKRVIALNYVDSKEELSKELATCNMLYVPIPGVSLELPQKLPSGVILVVDEPESYDPKIGITLTRSKEGRIEFGINQTAIIHAGVNISSQLLKLAKKPKYGGRDN